MKLSVVVPEGGKSLFSDFLLGLDAFSVAEDLLDNGKVEVSGYFSEETDIDHVQKRLKDYNSFLEGIMQEISIFNLNVEEIDESSWQLWKNRIKTVKVTDRIIIKPPWDRYRPKDNEIVIEINPSLAFGTGHHESTKLCIAGLEGLLNSAGNKSVLDAGCGSGVLSIVAAMLGAEKVVAFDIDIVAAKETKRNLERNSVSDKVSVVCGGIDSIKGEYDLIVANISVEELVRMRDELRSRLGGKGLLLLSGIPYSRRDELVSGMESSALNFREGFRKGDWVALIFSVA